MYHLFYFTFILVVFHKIVITESNEDDEFDSQSIHPLTVIRSKSHPKWMISVGGSQNDLHHLHYLNPQFRPKSMRMDFSASPNIPIPIILQDEIDNLDPIININKLEYDRLKQKVQDRSVLGHILIEVCGSEAPNGDLLMTMMWSENVALTSTVLLITDSNGDRSELEQKIMEGFLPISVCGFQRKGTSLYLLVLVRPSDMPEVPQSLAVVKIGQSFSDFLEQDRILARKGLSAHRLHVHLDSKGKLKCGAIYWPISSDSEHLINRGSDLKSLYSEVLQRKRGSEYAPKSVSRLMSNGTEEFIVLWQRGMPVWPLPPPIKIRRAGDPIPFQYIPGANVEFSRQLLSFFNHQIMEFMKRFDLPGLSVAIVKNENLKLAAGFGYANLKSQEQLTPTHKFRIGSISKIITATALALLVDEGVLDLDERVFGPNSIFDFDFSINSQYPQYINQITVRHLMSHTVGAWPNSEEDPIFKSTEFSSPKQLIMDTIHKHPLKSAPGMRFEYSNFGYAILGEVIERKTGMSYVEFVNTRLFEPIGMDRQNLLNVELINNEFEVLYYPTTETSDDPYELPNASILAACCGWSMTPVDMLRFLTHADGFQLKPDLISQESFLILRTPSKESNYTYGLGWTVNDRGFNGLSHQGQMPSTLSNVVRTDSGIEIIITTNRFPPRIIALSEISYLTHHLISLFEGPETDNLDHFIENPINTIF